LAPITNDLKLKKKELADSVQAGRQIMKNLKTLSASLADDKALLAQIDSSRKNAFDALTNFFGL